MGQTAPVEFDKPAQRRLAEYVVDRRHALEMRQEDINARGGPSKATLHSIEHARRSSYADDTIAGLEHALRWAPGSVAAIGRGEEPIELGPEPAEEVPGSELVVTYQGWTFSFTPKPGTPPEQVWAVQREILDGVMARLAEMGQAERSEGQPDAP